METVNDKLNVYAWLPFPEPAFDPSIANCDFENGLCLYHQDRVESKVWNRVSVKPNAYRIGDHTTGTGYFH